MSALKPSRRHSGQAGVGMKAAPQESHERAMEVSDLRAERPDSAPAILGRRHDRQFQSARSRAPREEMFWSRPDSSPVEARFQCQQKLGFPSERRGFIRTFLPGDAFDQTEQAQRAAFHAFRIRHAVAAEPVPEAFRLADIQDGVRRAVHEVNPRRGRQVPEKGAPQPLDQRLRVRPKALLLRLHRRAAHSVTITPLTKGEGYTSHLARYERTDRNPAAGV